MDKRPISMREPNITGLKGEEIAAYLKQNAKFMKNYLDVRNYLKKQLSEERRKARLERRKQLYAANKAAKKAEEDAARLAERRKKYSSKKMLRKSKQRFRRFLKNNPKLLKERIDLIKQHGLRRKLEREQKKKAETQPEEYFKDLSTLHDRVEKKQDRAARRYKEVNLEGYVNDTIKLRKAYSRSLKRQARKRAAVDPEDTLKDIASLQHNYEATIVKSRTNKAINREYKKYLNKEAKRLKKRTTEQKKKDRVQPSARAEERNLRGVKYMMTADEEPEFEFIKQSGRFEDYVLDYAFRDDEFKYSINDFLVHVFDATVSFISTRLEALKNIKFSLSLSCQCEIWCRSGRGLYQRGLGARRIFKNQGRICFQ